LAEHAAPADSGGFAAVAAEPQAVRPTMNQGKAIAAVAGVLGALVAVAFCVAAMYEQYALRDFRSWDEPGPPPIASALYYAHGDRVIEIMLTTTPGTSLADIADMSVFGPANRACPARSSQSLTELP
jgi:hypothetical protein